MPRTGGDLMAAREAEGAQDIASGAVQRVGGGLERLVGAIDGGVEGTGRTLGERADGLVDGADEATACAPGVTAGLALLAVSATSVLAVSATGVLTGVGHFCTRWRNLTRGRVCCGARRLLQLVPRPQGPQVRREQPPSP